ncbi:uncharacterized protein LOC112351059 [Selaginella moellendorffii]|uniref:uncharacterized protein LOC112351059 n=1 Tax=Selaginella moellendorffii TaxID=88036 RepID=UPI000D1C5175|nr:uncharacterized protein LOC112351059 [Selaginella moellendorffii]|eukprot:XP_024543967.1 uncharacterized protein LOC112351059 [Selaginella moellendorffii]
MDDSDRSHLRLELFVSLAREALQPFHGNGEYPFENRANASTCDFRTEGFGCSEELRVIKDAHQRWFVVFERKPRRWLALPVFATWRLCELPGVESFGRSPAWYNLIENSKASSTTLRVLFREKTSVIWKQGHARCWSDVVERTG